ncbi:hypothetical protein R1sor_004788 [Riccia sorocarpa]|uniref:DNA-(apurinic or apyrimidinic site) lyase n=1 Tax=Riccia sorocarpa TaxID=122646 RepID=A0ABD3HL69_9MARC
MVEGPGVHRVAIAHRRVLLGRAFTCSSPSGRFTEGAEIINGLYLSLIEAHGKNIFYFFTKQKIENAALNNLPEDVTVIHIHFGMSGSFRTYKFPGPEPRETTRLRLENEEENVVAHLSAMWCVLGSMDLYRSKIHELGPDPLREDADKEIAWDKMQKSKKSVGAFLMDQSMIAGIGNIYRCGKPLSKLRSGERRYIYNHKKCRRCGGPVINWVIATRTCYACEACQPPLDLVDPPKRRSKPKETEPADDDVLHESNGTAKNKPVTDATMVTTRVSRTSKSSTLNFRKRKVLDGKIVEHQALKDIPTGGLVDFPSTLDDLVWPNADPKTLKEEGDRTSPSVPKRRPSELTSQSSVKRVKGLGTPLEEGRVEGRTYRTSKNKKTANESIEGENKSVKRALRRTMSSAPEQADRLQTADEDSVTRQTRRSQRIRRSVGP